MKKNVVILSLLALSQSTLMQAGLARPPREGVDRVQQFLNTMEHVVQAANDAEAQDFLLHLEELLEADPEELANLNFPFAGNDGDIINGTPLFFAIQHENLPLLTLLLEHAHPTFETNGINAYTFLISQNMGEDFTRTALDRFFIAEENDDDDDDNDEQQEGIADIEFRDSRGRTALIEAISADNHIAVDELLNFINAWPNTPQIIVDENDNEIAQIHPLTIAENLAHESRNYTILDMLLAHPNIAIPAGFRDRREQEEPAAQAAENKRPRLE